MKFTSAILCLSLGSASAFAPSTYQHSRPSALSSTTEEVAETKDVDAPVAPTMPTAVVDGSIEMPSGSVAMGMDVSMPMTSVPDMSRIQPYVLFVLFRRWREKWSYPHEYLHLSSK